MTESDSERRGLWSTLLRWRAPILLVPLVVGLCYSGFVGARLLWAEANPTAGPGPVVTCWDGSEDTAADCPAPTGLAGLRWVFTSFRPFTGACEKVMIRKGQTPRPLEYACSARIQGGRATITYSERSDLERGLTFFSNRYEGTRAEPAAGGARLVYRNPAPLSDGTYEATVALTTYPFAVTVTAANERLRDAALDELVTYRADRFLTVAPPTASDQPDP